MRFIIEWDGVVFDVTDAWYAAHVAATKTVGWSQLGQSAFWRSIRANGREGDLLPGAKPNKLAEYRAAFDQRLESDEVVAMARRRDRAKSELSSLARHGEIIVVTLAANVAKRRAMIEQHGLDGIVRRLEGLNRDPRRRPAELRLLAASESRAVVVGSGDGLIRSAGFAELFAVGVACGPCKESLLHRAGAAVVYGELSALCDSLASGEHDLVRAGLPPRSLG